MAIKILDKFESTAANKVLADAAEIHDYTQNKSQAAINASVKSEIDTLKENGGSGSIKMGSGLEQEMDGTVKVLIGSADIPEGPSTVPAGLGFSGDLNYPGLVVKLGSGMRFREDGGISLNLGTGLEIDGDGKLFVGSDGSGSGGSGSITLGKGLVKDSTGAVRIKISTLTTDRTGYPGINIDNGLKISTQSDSLGVNISYGLAFGDDGTGHAVIVNAGDGLGFDSNKKLKVNAGDGLTVGTNDGALKVDIGKGLAIGSTAAVGNLGLGVAIDGQYIVYNTDGKLTLNITELKKALGLTA